MLDAAREMGADAIGMSGLLVKSTLIMRENLLEMNDRGVSDIPVILGGAALTRTYVERDLRSEYQGRLFYGKDAFEGLHTMDRLMELKRDGEDDPDFGRVLEGRAGARPEPPGPPAPPAGRSEPGSTPAADPDRPSGPRRSQADNALFTPPFVGSRIERGIPLDDIAAYLNETSLFRAQWGYRPDKSRQETDAEFKDRIRAELRAQLAAARTVGCARARGGVRLLRGQLRGRRPDRLEGRRPHFGVAALHLPPPGRRPVAVDRRLLPVRRRPARRTTPPSTWSPWAQKVSEETARLFAENRYQDYLHLHGLGVEMAEALAEFWHHRIREEWGFVAEDGPTLGGLFRQQYRGGRYSWGYEACPDLEDNAKCAELVGADRLGVEVSEETSWQFHPEQTTAAIICHHPQAKYFVVRRP